MNNMPDYRYLYETLVELIPDNKQRENLLLRNGLTCILPYLGEKNGRVMRLAQLLQKRRNVAVFACMREVRNLCIEAGIPYAFLKGLCLAAQLYDPPETRIFGDVDVLVSAKDCRQLIQKCLEAGFTFEGNVSDDSEAPYMRMQNGHMHAEVLKKEYDTGNGRITIPLEVHVSPNERCYEMYGHILEDNGYTEALLSRARPITIQIDGESEETFMIPDTEDNIYIQSLHMIMHLALDQVLYLYVDKPCKSQSVLKQVLDILIFAEKEKPDWKTVEKLAIDQGHQEEYICAVSILNRIGETDILIEGQASDCKSYNRPIDFVCRILDRIDIQTIMGNDGSLKEAVDREICEWIRGQKNTLLDGMRVSLSEEGITLTVDTTITKPGKYTVTLYVANGDNEWKIQDYMLELSEEDLVFHQSDGYRIIWDHETYGKVPIQQAAVLSYRRVDCDKLSQRDGTIDIPIDIVMNERLGLLITIGTYSNTTIQVNNRFMLGYEHLYDKTDASAR